MAKINTSWAGRRGAGGQRWRAKPLSSELLKTRAHAMSANEMVPAHTATKKMIDDLLQELHDVDFVKSLLQDAHRRPWLLQAWMAEAIYGLAFYPYDYAAKRKRLSRALRRIDGWAYALSLDLLQELRSHQPPTLLALSAMSRLLYAGYSHPLAEPATTQGMAQACDNSILMAPKIRQEAKTERRVYVCGFRQDELSRSFLRFVLANCVRWPDLQEPAAAQIGLMVHGVADSRASCAILNEQLHPVALNRLKVACEFSCVPWVILAETSAESFHGALLELEERI